MKKVLLILLVLCLIGCQSKPAKEVTNDLQAQSVITLLPTEEGHCKYMMLTYDVVYDGCDYIITRPYNGNEITLTHKGNCRNPIHQKSNEILTTIYKELKSQSEDYHD